MISAQSSSWDEPYNCESLSNEGFQAENNIHPRISSYIIWIRKEKNDFFVGPHIIRIYFLAGSCNDPSVRKEQTLTIYGEKVNGRYPEFYQYDVSCVFFDLMATLQWSVFLQDILFIIAFPHTCAQSDPWEESPPPRRIWIYLIPWHFEEYLE